MTHPEANARDKAIRDIELTIGESRTIRRQFAENMVQMERSLAELRAIVAERIAMTTPTDPVAGPHALQPQADTDLAVSAASLSTELTELNQQIATLQNSDHRSWRAIKGGAWFITFDVLATALGLWLGIIVYQQNHRIETSVHEQCSLYSLIIPSYRETTRQTSPLGPTGYDNAFRRLQISSDTLGCAIPHVVKP